MLAQQPIHMTSRALPRCRRPDATARPSPGQILLLAMILLALASVAHAEAPETAALEQRVAEYWDAISAFDLATAYRLERGSREGRLTAAQFRRYWSRSDWELQSFEVESVAVEDGSAEVGLELVFDVPELPKDIVRRYNETWTLVEGQWLRDAGDIGG